MAKLCPNCSSPLILVERKLNFKKYFCQRRICLYSEISFQKEDEKANKTSFSNWQYLHFVCLLLSWQVMKKLKIFPSPFHTNKTYVWLFSSPDDSLTLEIPTLNAILCTAFCHNLKYKVSRIATWTKSELKNNINIIVNSNVSMSFLQVSPCCIVTRKYATSFQ